MADIAIVFHWPSSAMERMPLATLMGWHKRAVERLAIVRT